MATCKFYGKAGLTWREHDRGWCLHVPSGGLHACHDPAGRLTRRERKQSRRHVFSRADYGDDADEAWVKLAGVRA